MDLRQQEQQHSPAALVGPPARQPLPLPLPQQSARVLMDAEDPSRIWLPELVQRFAGFLAGNEVACVLRLVNKAAATQLSRPQDRTVKLSQPVPHAEFARRWGGADAMRSLNLSQRFFKLPSLTARSGCLANLEVLVTRGDMSPYVRRMLVLEAAAAAGQLAVCRWLRLQGCPSSSQVLTAAAKGGHKAVCEWLLANGCPPVDEHGLAAAAAARGGHVGLMDWLLGLNRRPSSVAEDSLLEGAATGCDLPTLQRVRSTYPGSSGSSASDDGGEDRVPSESGLVCALAGAAASSTPDWRAKVEWLEGQGCPKDVWACVRVARYHAAGRARLEWLHQRGYPLSAEVAAAAASSGDLDALHFVLAAGVVLEEGSARKAVLGAAAAGHLAVLKALLLHLPHADRRSAFSRSAAAAAEVGHLPVVVCLAEALGDAEVLTAHVFSSAARSGSMELLAWLHARGCPWDASIFLSATERGSEEQLEWLAARGCPMAENGAPFDTALQYTDLPMLRCLRRLGCPWGPNTSTFTHAVWRWRACSVPLPDALRALRWLLDEGCPVDWDAAVHEARKRPELRAWLVEQRRQRDAACPPAEEWPQQRRPGQGAGRRWSAWWRCCVQGRRR